MAKIAQIGCGHWGKNLTRNFAQLGALACVVEGNAETAQAMSAEYDVPAKSFEDVLADPSIDAVALATPAETHATLATKALEAGKHAYVEKPIALSVEDAVALVKLAEQRDRRLMVGHLLQYHPIFMKLRSLVAQGKVGEVLYVYSNRLSLGKFRTEENVLWSFAPHDLSMLLSVAGEEPSHVNAQGASYFTSGIADWCTASLTFPSGVRGHLNVSWMHPFKEQRFVVCGKKGALVFEDSKAEWSEKLAFYPHTVDVTTPAPLPTKGDVELIDVDHGEPLKAECQHFIDCIDNGTDPRTNGAEGLAVLRVLSSMEKSLAESLEG